jgi:hypothetical protein
MLKLVESLALKTERAKRTAVEIIPLRDSEIGIFKCGWCEATVRGKRKGWNSYRATECKPVPIQIRGDICPRRECRISLQAKYTKR